MIIPKSLLWRILVIAYALNAIFVGEGNAQSRERNPLEAGNELDGIMRLPDSVIPYGVTQSWFDFNR
jgi:hypothetical protein